MDPKIVGIVFTVVYLSVVLPATSIKLVTRDPETGYVIPPAVNQGPPKATTNYKRDTIKNEFTEELEEVPVQYIESEPYSYDSEHDSEDTISRDLHKFPSIFDQFQHPFQGPDASLFSSSGSTSKRHTNYHSFPEHTEYHEGHDGFEEDYHEPHVEHHVGEFVPVGGHHHEEEIEVIHHHGPPIEEDIHYVDNNDLNFIRPVRHKRKNQFRKRPFRPAPFGVGGRPKRRPHQHHHHHRPHAPHRQPHKYRKKYPYYGRKKRSPEPMPWVLLDPMTGRNIRYPKQLYSSASSPAKRQNEFVTYNKESREDKRTKRGKGKVSPCFGTYFNEECNYLIDTAVPQEPKQDRDSAIPEPIVSNSIRHTRNLFPAAKSNNDYKTYPIYSNYDKYRYYIGREKGSEYLSRYSGIPVYKYTKKYPHGYGRKKRSAEPSPWAILDPMTGRPVEEEPRRAYNNRPVQARNRPTQNRYRGNFFSNSNPFNGRPHLFYNDGDYLSNEIREERRTKKNRPQSQSFRNGGNEYYMTHSGKPMYNKPVYKYYKKNPFGYGRKRRSAQSQKWQLIDPLTGRPVEPQNSQPRPRPTPKKNNRRPNKPQDVLFGQFFQKQIRSERFQPGPPLAPEPQAVSNNHEPIGDNQFKSIQIHTGDRDQDHFTSNGRPVYKHHKRYPYLG